MLTVLLALTVVTSPQLPLPAKPASMTQHSVEFTTCLVTRFDRLSASAWEPAQPSNYRLWRDNGWEWFREKYNDVRLPSQACPINQWVEISYTGLYRRPVPFRPWGGVYQERSGLLWNRYFASEFVGYLLIREPRSQQGCYCAVIEGLPYHVVRASTLEELEKKVVERFRVFVEEATTMADDNPPFRGFVGW